MSEYGINQLINQSLIRQEDLAAWLGYDQNSRAKIESWLSNRGIPFQISRDRIVTTIQAVNAGLIGEKQQDSGFEFD